MGQDNTRPTNRMCAFRLTPYSLEEYFLRRWPNIETALSDCRVCWGEMNNVCILSLDQVTHDITCHAMRAKLSKSVMKTTDGV